MDELAIFKSLGDIIRLLSTNQVIFVDAPTGSGKSLGIPGILGSRYQTIVTVPTRTAAISLKKRQKFLKPKYKVTTAIKTRDKSGSYDPSSNIIYATSGYIYRRFLSLVKNWVVDPKMKEIDMGDVLILDEYHSQSLDNHMIVQLYLYALNKEIKLPRLILSSATPISPQNTQFPRAPVFSAQIKTYKVDETYHQRDFTLVEYRGRQLYEETAEQIYSAHVSKKIPAADAFLVFVPGKREILNLIDILRGKKMDNVVLLGLHGEMAEEEINAAINPVEEKRKIVVATNVAETAITIKNVAIVFDTMIERIKVSTQTGGSRFDTVLISKTSAIQRAGRAGRTKEGTVYRMMTQKTYQTLEDRKEPEIRRVPIHNTILQLYSSYFTPEQIETFLSDVGETTDEGRKKVHDIFQVLKNSNFISPTGITDKGRFGSLLTLGITMSGFLWDWKEVYPNDIFNGIVIACFIDSYGPNYFFYDLGSDPSKRQNVISEMKKDYFLPNFAGKSDIDVFLRIWASLTLSGEHLKTVLGYNRDYIRQWAATYSMNNRQILRLVDSIIDTKSVFESYPEYGKVRLLYLKDNETIIRKLSIAAQMIFEKIYANQILKYSDVEKLFVDSDGNRYQISRETVNDLSKESRIIPLIVQEYGSMRVSMVTIDAHPGETKEKKKIYEIPDDVADEINSIIYGLEGF